MWHLKSRQTQINWQATEILFYFCSKQHPKISRREYYSKEKKKKIKKVNVPALFS